MTRSIIGELKKKELHAKRLLNDKFNLSIRFNAATKIQG
jgi:hypothetical protein